MHTSVVAMPLPLNPGQRGDLSRDVIYGNIGFPSELNLKYAPPPHRAGNLSAAHPN